MALPRPSQTVLTNSCIIYFDMTQVLFCLILSGTSLLKGMQQTVLLLVIINWTVKRFFFNTCAWKRASPLAVCIGMSTFIKNCLCSAFRGSANPLMILEKNNSTHIVCTVPCRLKKLWHEPMLKIRARHSCE